MSILRIQKPNLEKRHQLYEGAILLTDPKFEAKINFRPRLCTYPQ
jgi:hypothetical protein